MRIVLDLQGCQSPGSRVRGIGRYSMALAQAIARHPRGHEIWIALNGAFADTVEPIRGAFDGLLPQERIVVWETVGPVAEADQRNRARRRAAECLREDFLARLRPDVVHVSTLIEGWADDVTASIGRLGRADYLTALTLYDLIPLARRDAYLQDPRVRAWYLGKLECLKRADLLLAISDFAGREAVELLGLPAERIANISAAVDPAFRRLDASAAALQRVCTHYGITRPFVMYTGGMDPRKNIAGLLRAYAALPPALRAQHQLLIVGTASHEERHELQRNIAELAFCAGEVVFAGYVPDDDLITLYNACRLYVFPSFHEGFGLPALEAMACGAVVVGADATSLPEVIGHPKALFDPADPSAMAACVARALTDDALRSELLRHASAQLRKFSWAASAERALDAFERAVGPAGRAGPGAERRHDDAAPRRLRVVLAPLLATADAAHASGPVLGELVAPLSRDCDVTLVAVSEAARALAVESRLPCLAPDDFVQQAREFDAILFEIADVPGLAGMLPLLARHRAAVYLHGVDVSVARTDVETVLGDQILEIAGGYPALQNARRDGPSARLQLSPWLEQRAQDVLRAADGRAPAATGAWALEVEAWLRRVARESVPRLADALVSAADAPGPELDDADLVQVAVAIDRNRSRALPHRQLLVDISYLVERDARTGIQRVVYNILAQLLRSAPAGFVVEPVYFDAHGNMFRARSYCAQHLGLEEPGTADPAADPAADPRSGDVFLGLDLAPDFVPRNAARFAWLRNRRVRVCFVVYDLLPLLRPECFQPAVCGTFARWARTVAETADEVLCISKAVADEMTSWLDASSAPRHRPLSIKYFHLGADFAPPGDQPLDASASATLARIRDGAPAFLMVSTIEPRKGHAQTLAAFERLWAGGSGAKLVIVGKVGWLVDDLIERLRSHPELGQRLFWFERASDAWLAALYGACSALLAASEAEGFGLPLVEAAHYGLPVICRDIPVFREVAGKHATYFDGWDAESLERVLQSWLRDAAAGTAVGSAAMPRLAWAQSTAQMLQVLLEWPAYRHWSPSGRQWFPAYDGRLRSPVGRLERGIIATTGIDGWLLLGPGVDIPRGHYRVRIFGALEWSRCGECRFEVASRVSGDVLHFDYLLPRVGEPAAPLLDAEVTLESDVREVEFRIWVSPSVRLAFEGVELQRLGAGAVDAT